MAVAWPDACIDLTDLIPKASTAIQNAIADL
jgi:hypothetical protein